jgi:hypothetical protein
MEKKVLKAVCAAAFSAWLAGCAQGIFPSALGIPAGAVFSPPVSVLEKKSPDETVSRLVSAGAPRLSLMTLQDRRESKSIIRSVRGYQGWLYQATGWRIDAGDRIDEIVTASIRAHLEKSGMWIEKKPDRRVLNVAGDIRKFYVNKTGDLENSWTAYVEITIRMTAAGKKAPLKVYNLNGYAEQYNWRGAVSGAQALTDALEEAVKQIPTQDIRILTEKYRRDGVF